MVTVGSAAGTASVLRRYVAGRIAPGRNLQLAEPRRVKRIPKGHDHRAHGQVRFRDHLAGIGLENRHARWWPRAAQLDDVELTRGSHEDVAAPTFVRDPNDYRLRVAARHE